MAAGVNSKIKIALIGCGRISERHLDAIKFHKKSVQVNAICDLDNSRLQYVENNLRDNIDEKYKVKNLTLLRN